MLLWIMKLFLVFSITTILRRSHTHAFTSSHGSSRYDSRTCASSSALKMVPLSSFTDKLKRTYLASDDAFRTCIDENGELRSDDENGSYVVAVAEEDDLPNISQLTINAFGADAITLGTELSPLEKSLLNPGIGAFNAYSGMVAYKEVLSGLRQRMRDRLNPENIDELLAPPPVMNIDDVAAKDVAAKSSVILVLGREKEVTESWGRNANSKEIEAIATVELRLQPTDAKIPFSEPWFDRIERALAKFLKMDVKPKDRHLQPYLSNLCVDESVRGRQIGKAMCRVVERIAKDAWGYEKLYLHVDLENIAALNLYKKENYQDVGSRWNPFWAGKAAEIGYYYKKL